MYRRTVCPRILVNTKMDKTSWPYSTKESKKMNIKTASGSSKKKSFLMARPGAPKNVATKLKGGGGKPWWPVHYKIAIFCDFPSSPVRIPRNVRGI